MNTGQLRLALGNAIWTVSNRADLDCNEIYRRHYSARKCDARQFVGPGEDIVLVTPRLDALFVWRKFIDHTIPHQAGVQCAVFRNEGTLLSSHLILAAEAFAVEEWPIESRFYTFVDARKTRPKRHPGRCFIEAGWRRCGKTQGGLLIFEKLVGRAA
jgi:hypothetical protein